MTRNMTAKLFGGPILALSVMALGAPAAAASQDDPEPLRVCVAELQPWIYTGEGDDIRGFEVDALNGMAEELNMEPTFIVREFDQLKPSLMKGECDMIASGFSITLERVQDVSFSVPYNQTEYHLLVPTGSAEEYDDLDAFDSPDMRIGHLAGGVSGQVAEEFFPNARLVPLKSRIDSLDAFRNDEIDAYVSSDPFDQIIEQVAPGEFTTFGDDLLRVSIEAFAVRKGNTELLDKINPFIIRGVNENYFRTLHRKWFTREEMLTGY